MRCAVYITPPGRDTITANLVAEPEYSEGPGGYISAQVVCTVPRHHDRLLDAAVEIHPPKGLPWLGRVARVTGSDVLTLTCTGAQSDLSRELAGPLPYCDTSLDFDDLNGPNWGAFQRSVSVATLDIGQSPNTEAAVGDYAGYYRYYGLPLDSVTCSYEVNHADVRLDVFACLADGTRTSGMAISSKTVGSGTLSLDLAGARGVAIRAIVVNAPSTPARYDKWVKVWDLKVYGVDGVTSVTAPAVINDVCDRLPAWILPAGAEYRHWIAADAVAIEPFVTDHTATALDVISEITAYRDYDFSMRARLVGGRYVAVPVYEPRDTGPAYYLHTDAEIGLGGIDGLADSVRVSYRDASGKTRYLDVTDDSDDNHLHYTGQGKTGTLSVDTASEATALLMGQRYLASKRAQKVAGSIDVTGGLTDANGAEVLPCQIEAGRWVTIYTPNATVTARITQAEKVGAYSARITLDDTPTGLDTELALLQKRRQEA